MHFAAIAVCASLVASPSPERAKIVSRTEAFLAAYAGNDVEHVIAMTDAHDLSIYGSDLAEFCTNRSCLRDMLASDFRLWGSARFGAIEDVTVVSDGHLAVIFFNVPFFVGGGGATPVRVAMVWRKVNGAWLLSQSSNVVPTQGSTAKDVLANRSAKP